MTRLAWIVVALLPITSCRDTIVIPTQASPAASVTPSTPIPSTTPDLVEFRVTGNASGAVVRYSDATNGLTQITTTLPFITTFRTLSPFLFLSVQTTPTGFVYTPYPFVSVQIFVNGVLFKEASSTSGLLDTIAVDGTWRHQ